VLIDSKHVKWGIATAVVAVLAIGLHLWWGRHVPGGLTGGTTIGLWYGVIGTALMIYAGLLAAHRRIPSVWHWWLIGPRKRWLRGHIWLGLLSVVFILAHSGYRWGGTLEVALWLVFGLTILTGIVGLVLQHYLPNLMTNRLDAETPYEQIPHVCDVLRQEADGVLQEVRTRSDLNPQVKDRLARFYQDGVRPFLVPRFDRRSKLSRPLEAELLFGRVAAEPGMDLLEEPLSRLRQIADERRQMGEQETLHWWLHSWLLLHVPITLALLILATAHIIASLYY
jgi:hypothetical protein